MIRVTEGSNVPDTITITDDRTGKTGHGPDHRRGVPGVGGARARPDRCSSTTRPSCQTAACKSAITYLDGDAGILRYRGYPIEQLAEQSHVPRGRLPAAQRRAARHAEQLRAVDATTSPTTRSSTRTCASGSSTASTTTPTRWACSSRAVAALGTFYPDAKDIYDPDSRDKQILRLIAKMPTLAAMCYRFSRRPAVRLPGQRRCRFPANFLNMMWKIGEYEIDPRARAGDGRAVHPPRRPRAELRHHGDARRRLEPRRPVLGVRRGRGRRCTARCTAAPTRRSCACSPRSARIDNVPAFIDDGQGAARAA